MKPSEIQVGKTYQNKGAGTTKRKVLAIGDEHRPKNWLSEGPAPDEPGVLYESSYGHGNYTDTLYLSSFASWAGREYVEGSKLPTRAKINRWFNTKTHETHLGIDVEVDGKWLHVLNEKGNGPLFLPDEVAAKKECRDIIKRANAKAADVAAQD